MNIDYTVFEQVNRINEYFEDELSKKIFKMRVLANITGDIKHIHQMISNSDSYDWNRALEIYDKIDENYNLYSEYDVLAWIIKNEAKGKLILFGVGRDSYAYRSLMDAFGIEYNCIVDNNNYGMDIDGHRVYSVKESANIIKESYIIITSMKYCEEMTNQLLQMGVLKERIFQPKDNALIAYCDSVYFDNNIWNCNNGMVFVDGGSYNLFSSYEFSNWCRGNYKKIIAFEPDCNNVCLCNSNISAYGLHNVDVVNAGLSENDGYLHFEHAGNSGASSFISENGNEQVKVYALDSYLNGEKCDFIKLDIEGSELLALKGAEKTIRKYKPRLAICVYHKNEDIFEIPEYIKGIVPEYKFKLRHYSTYYYDTILYAYI